VTRHREYVGDCTRLVEELQVDGFVVKPEDLEVLDSMIRCCELFPTEDPDNPPVFRASLDDGSVVQFHDVDELRAHPNTPPARIVGLTVTRLGDGNRRVEVELAESGELVIDACGPAGLVEAALHRLRLQLRGLDQEYSWFVRLFVIDRRPRVQAALLAILACAVLLYSVGLYLYALNVGVDISGDLIPPGMTYYQAVEGAIRSDDVGDKLDVLLIGNLRGFMNVTDFLQSIRTTVIACLWAILILGAAAWILWHLKRYYPPSFFALGHQQEKLARMQRTRDLWVGAIIVSFLVNLVAGVLVATLG